MLIEAAALTMLVLPLGAVLRLRRRGRPDLAPWWRVLCALLAAALTIGALRLLDETADELLAGHMLQHVLIGDLVPLLLVLAVGGPLLFHLFPVSVVRAARRLGRQHLIGLATRPLPAFVVWAAALAAWHVPALYDRALENERLHAFEHATFLLGGLLVWSVLLDPARRGLLPGWRRFGYAVALFAVSAALGNALVLSYRPLYPAYDVPAAQRPYELTPLRDQNLAAVVMMIEQLATFGTFALLAARRQLRLAPSEERLRRHPLAE